MNIISIIDRYNDKFILNGEIYRNMNISTLGYIIDINNSKYLHLLKSILNIFNTKISDKTEDLEDLEDLGYSFDLFINLLNNLLLLIDSDIYDSNYSKYYLFIINLLSEINININKLLDKLLFNKKILDRLLLDFNNIVDIDIVLILNNNGNDSNSILNKNLEQIKIEILNIYTEVIIINMNT